MRAAGRRFCYTAGRLKPLASIFAFVLSATTLAVAQRSPDHVVTQAPGHVDHLSVDIASNDSGLVCVAWADARDRGQHGRRESMFVRSLDGGLTWEPEVVISHSSGNVESVRVAVVGSTVYATWLDFRSGQFEVYFNRSLDGGVTWAPSDTRISNIPTGQLSFAETPKIVASGQHVWITWVNYDGTNPRRVYVDRSSDAGVTWLANDVEFATASGGQASTPSIAVEHPVVCVAWPEFNGSRSLHCNTSLDGGVTWQPTNTLIRANGYGLRLAAFGPLIFATWYEFTLSTSDVYFSSSNDSGLTWSSPVVLNSGRTGTAPAIAVEYPNIYVAWADSRLRPPPLPVVYAYDVYLNASSDGGATWLGSEIRLNTNTPGVGDTHGVDLLARDGAVFASWVDWRSGSPEIWANYSGDLGTTWLGGDLRLDSAVTVVEKGVPTLTKTSGSVSVAWADGRGAGATTEPRVGLIVGGTPYGAGLAGTGAVVPSLAQTRVAIVGQPTRFELDRGVGGAPAALLFGFGGRAAIPVLGGTLLVNAPHVPVSLVLSGAAGTPGQGAATFAPTLPNSPGLVGDRVRVQGFVIDPASPGGLSMSNAVEILIG